MFGTSKSFAPGAVISGVSIEIDRNYPLGDLTADGNDRPVFRVRIIRIQRLYVIELHHEGRVERTFEMENVASNIETRYRGQQVRKSPEACAMQLTLLVADAIFILPADNMYENSAVLGHKEALLAFEIKSLDLTRQFFE